MNTKITLICLQCKKEYKDSPSRKDRKYCSKVCHNESKVGVTGPRKGQIVSIETREKISKSLTGKVQSQETIDKRTSKITGENAGMWKGGISFIDKSIRTMKEYKDWRTSIFIRDNFTCQDCGNKGYITAHHIKGFSQILKDNNIKNRIEARNCDEIWDITNGKTLCEECHKTTDNYNGRGMKKTKRRRIVV